MIASYDFMRKLRGRDNEAYRELRENCYKMAVKISGNAEEAEDLTQEAMLNVIENIDKYNPAQSRISTWIYGIIKRKNRQRIEHNIVCKNHIEKNKWKSKIPRKNILEERLEPVAARLISYIEERRADNLECEIMLITEAYGLSNEHAAKFFGIKENTLRSIKYREKVYLRKLKHLAAA